jgi:hypothetical protein
MSNRWQRPSYCQIYCQKRGGEGIPGDGELQVFSNLLISICAYVGSTKSRSDFGRRVRIGPERSGGRAAVPGREQSHPLRHTRRGSFPTACLIA